MLRTRLKNGLRVIVQESRAAPVAAFFVFYQIGSRQEPPGYTGAGHWVEHMLFRGTAQFPPGEFDRIMARSGAVFNALTSPDWTLYYETLPAHQLSLAIEAESDRMINAIFAPQDFEAERSVILTELEGAENSAYWLLMDEVRAIAYQVHGYHHPTIGWRDDLLQMTRDALYGYYRQAYTPGEAVIVAVGDFSAQAALDQIEAAFGHIPPVERLTPLRRVVEPPQRVERRVILHGTDPTAHVVIAFHTVAADHADFFPLVIMDAILSGAKGMGLFGGGINSRRTRLNHALVETEIAVYAGTWFEPTLDPGLFWLNAAHSPEIPHATVEEALLREIERLQNEPAAADELARAVKQTRAQFAYGRESVSAQAYWLGFSELVADSAWLEGWDDALAQVTAADVQRVAQTYFRRENRNIGWYVPEAEQLENETPEADEQAKAP